MKLYILRHAKTDQNSISGKDFDRKLLKKGLAQSKEMGEYFFKMNFNPTRIYCSSATRTRETLANIQKQHALECNINYIDSLYLAEKDHLLKFLWSQEGGGTTFIIGHNNGLSDFAAYLIDDFVDLKTCDFLEIEFHSDSWKETSKGSGKIISSYHPEV